MSSVALYTPRQVRDIRSIALDSSSRTAAALLRILCAQRFGIEPEFVTMRPDLPAMLDRCDAALLIGGAALFVEHGAIDKIDLGEAWTAMTGLPFVWCSQSTILPSGVTTAGGVDVLRFQLNRCVEVPGNPTRQLATRRERVRRWDQHRPMHDRESL